MPRSPRINLLASHPTGWGVGCTSCDPQTTPIEVDLTALTDDELTDLADMSQRERQLRDPQYAPSNGGQWPVETRRALAESLAAFVR